MRQKFAVLFLLSFYFIHCGPSKEIRVYQEDMVAPTPSASLPSQKVSHSFEWILPKGWVVSQNTSQVSLADFEISSLKTKVSLSTLGGDAGGELNNVNRWREQVGLKSIVLSELKLNTLKGKLGDWRWIQIEGHNDQAILAAFLYDGMNTHFVKAKADRKKILELKESFLVFVQSIKKGL